jgi:hypothetical protein
MVDTKLSISLAPANITFTYKDEETGDSRTNSWDCSVNDIQDFLLELELIDDTQKWPPTDYIIKAPYTVSHGVFAKIQARAKIVRPASSSTALHIDRGSSLEH